MEKSLESMTEKSQLPTKPIRNALRDTAHSQNVGAHAKKDNGHIDNDE